MNSVVTLEFITDYSSHTYLFSAHRSDTRPSCIFLHMFLKKQLNSAPDNPVFSNFQVSYVSFIQTRDSHRNLYINANIIPQTIDFANKTTITIFSSKLKTSCVRDEYNKIVYNSFQCCFLQTMTQISIRSDRNLNHSAHYTHTISISKLFECIREPKQKQLSLKLSQSSER